MSGEIILIAIVDYGVGNLGSIYNMLKKANAPNVMIASSSDDLVKADKYVLPGVGAFDTGMKLLNTSGMREEIERQVIKKCKPILGICLGMQMLGNGSEEGVEKGLGYIDFCCKKFRFDSNNLRIPHMGWDYVDITNVTPLTVSPKEKTRFYFAHSFYAECTDKKNVLFTCDYGNTFVAGVNRGNIYGVQFHPEKSHSFGKWLFKNYVEEV